MKTTGYFEHVRRRPDRARILDKWIELAISQPVAEKVQSDGRVQRWTFIASEGRYLRIVLLEDRETVHNAFFDRGFRP
ncbi:MAG TPA: hypothetical protein VES88_09815 [Gemmatimonadaceae bacterium]|nr:hypothetical protein [Gemmatimonadaceae bacterium]